MTNIETSNPAPAALAAPHSKLTSRFLFWVREAVSICFWTYAICKLFVFDLDRFVLGVIDPNLIFLTDYKFFLLIGLAAIFLILSKKHFLIWTAYILGYPFIIFCWRLPYAIFRQRSWTLAFAIINAFISFFKSIKFKIVICAVLAISILFIVSLSNRQLLAGSLIALGSSLLIAYIRMSLFAFQPSSIFQSYSYIIKASPRILESQIKADTEIRNLPIEKLSASQIETFRASVQLIVLSNRALIFFAHRLREYQQSKLNAVAYAFNLVVLLLFTVASFAAINLGLFKIDNSQLSVVGTANYFIFFFYSFHAFHFGSVPEIIAADTLSRVLQMCEQGFAIWLSLILIALFFTVHGERYKEELERTISDTERTSEVFETLIQTEYHLTFDQALEEIRKMKANMLSFIVWLSQDMK